MQTLKTIYNQAFTALNLLPCPNLFTQLITNYQEPHRHYHTLQHLQQLFTALQNIDLSSSLNDRSSIILSIFFHDAIYDTRSHENEAQSAKLASESLTKLNLPNTTIDRITHLIHLTKYHPAQPTDLDAQLLLDLDLSILATPPIQYQTYAKAIRQEYDWVHESDYRKGRSQILQTFLNRDRIYHHPQMQHHESQARINLNQEIETLNQNLI
jgi:predicted metal-dependent HD superfamily phosphohydrolase